MFITESRCSTAEMNTALSINYTSIKNKFKKFLFWPFKLFLTALLTQNSLPVPTTFLISNCQQYILNYFFILIWVGKKILYFHHSD